jgi:hypothetical protein
MAHGAVVFLGHTATPSRPSAATPPGRRLPRLQAVGCHASRPSTATPPGRPLPRLQADRCHASRPTAATPPGRRFHARLQGTQHFFDFGVKRAYLHDSARLSLSRGFDVRNPLKTLGRPDATLLAGVPLGRPCNVRIHVADVARNVVCAQRVENTALRVLRPG